MPTDRALRTVRAEYPPRGGHEYRVDFRRLDGTSGFRSFTSMDGARHYASRYSRRYPNRAVYVSDRVGIRYEYINGRSVHG